LHSLLRGAGHGLLAGLAYWAVEYFFTTTVEVAVKEGLVVPSWHWPMSAALLVCYCGVGLVCGLAAGLFASPRRVAAMLFVAVFLTSGLLVTDRWYDDEFLLVAVALLAVGLVSRIQRLASPWVASLLLLGPFWFYQEFLVSFPRPSRAIILLALAVMGVTVMRLAWRWLPAITPANDAVLAMLLVPALPLISWMLRDAGAPSLPASAVRAPEGPNIVLLVMDTVRADHLPVHGYPRDTAPHLAEFARGATVYRRAIAAGDVSLPSHAALFTGLYANRHGAHNVLPEFPVGRPLEDEAVTVAEVLANRGYRTIGVTANHAYLGPAFGLGQGFEVVDSRRPVQVRYQWSRHYLRAGVKALLNRAGRGEQWTLAYRRAEEVNETVFTLLKDVTGPFFLFVNYMDAQGHVAHARGDPAAPEMVPGRRRMTAEQRARVIDVYDLGIASADAGLGGLMAGLRERRRYEDSLIVVTSDHGEAFGEKDLAGHGVAAIHALVHVPLVVKFPNQREGSAIDALASHVDFAPTALEAAGVEPPPLDGVSWMSPPGERCVFAESYPHQSLYDFSARFRRIERAAYCGDRKLIVSTAGGRELYDPWRDPREERDLMAAEPERATEMERRLVEWMKSAKPRPPTAGPLDRDAVERLRSLGYMQ
jgi:arylsulfatase A-like enzyme